MIIGKKLPAPDNVVNKGSGYLVALWSDFLFDQNRYGLTSDADLQCSAVLNLYLTTKGECHEEMETSCSSSL